MYIRLLSNVEGDHAGGNNELSKYYQSRLKTIYGGRDCAAVTHVVGDNETFTIGKGLKITGMHTPCHTQDSVCYFVESDDGSKAVFTG